MRSKCALAANIWTTLYGGILFWLSIGSAIREYGADFFKYQETVFRLMLSDVGMNLGSVQWIYIIILLFYVNILLYILGALLGWIGFAVKKSVPLLWAAIFYLLGTICFPFSFFFGIPAIILGFLGYSNQKNINRKVN